MIQVAEQREKEVVAFEPTKDMGSSRWPRAPQQRVRGVVLSRMIAAEYFFLIETHVLNQGIHSMQLETLESIQKGG